MKMKMAWSVLILGISILWISFQPRLVLSDEVTFEGSNGIALGEKNESTLKVVVAVPEFILNLGEIQQVAYSTFLASIRTNVQDPTIRYGGTNIPVVAAPSNTYIRLNLQLSAGNIISFAMKRNDLYLAAYITRNERQQLRVYYFAELISSADLDKVFPEAKGATNQQKITEYAVTYQGVEAAATVNRKKAGLGFDIFRVYINAVYQKARNVRDEATFILVAAQMLAEATRYRYIEHEILANFPARFTPSDNVIILERNWDRVTKAVKSSTNGVFKEPVKLEANVAWVTTDWTVSNANELDMGILLYLGKTLSSASPLQAI